MSTSDLNPEMSNGKSEIDKESVRKAMELAWQDHHHARDQTWKTLQIVAGLAAGLLTIDYTYQRIIPTICAAILVIIAAVVGASITWSHRKLERRKFIHIMNCEEFLGLHKDFLIPLDPTERLNKAEPTKTKDSYNEEKKEKIIAKDDESKKKENEEFWLNDDSMVGIPKKFKFSNIFDPRKSNTALFILRMHITIICFCLLIVVLRIMEICSI